MSKQVTLYLEEVIVHSWNLNIPDDMDEDNADEIYDWALNNSEIDFSDGTATHSELNVEKGHE